MTLEGPVATEGQKPKVRSIHGAATVGKDLFVFGGLDYPTYYKDLHQLDTETLTWAEISIKGDVTPRSGMSLWSFNWKLYIFGG